MPNHPTFVIESAWTLTDWVMHGSMIDITVTGMTGERKFRRAASTTQPLQRDDKGDYVRTWYWSDLTANARCSTGTSMVLTELAKQVPQIAAAGHLFGFWAMSDYEALVQTIQQEYRDHTDSDGQWDTVDIASGIADILNGHGRMQVCDLPGCGMVFPGDEPGHCPYEVHDEMVLDENEGDGDGEGG